MLECKAGARRGTKGQNNIVGLGFRVSGLGFRV